jgi:hypothetical protein
MCAEPTCDIPSASRASVLGLSAHGKEEGDAFRLLELFYEPFPFFRVQCQLDPPPRGPDPG